MSGASTNPDPDVFAYSAATIKTCMDATKKLGGENYVLWGGREGYETLLNTDLKRELDQMARMLHMVVEYKHKIGFKGTILVEPKPQEPSKHQYDYDVATVYGFLKTYGLENEVKLNIEQGHAILAGHSFEHELALANALGVFGSIDMNRNDYQSGWDTDQFPNNVPEMALAYYHVLAGGGFKTGGTNFDAKLRRQSLDPEDLLIGHIGGMDCCARGLKAAAKMIEDKALSGPLAARYAGWDKPENKACFGRKPGVDRRAGIGSGHQPAAEVGQAGTAGKHRQPVCLRLIAAGVMRPAVLPRRSGTPHLPAGIFSPGEKRTGRGLAVPPLPWGEGGRALAEAGEGASCSAAYRIPFGGPTELRTTRSGISRISPSGGSPRREGRAAGHGAFADGGAGLADGGAGGDMKPESGTSSKPVTEKSRGML